MHHSLSKTLPLNTAQDVSQDHFPTYSIFYGVDRLVIDCCLLMFFSHSFRRVFLFGVFTCLVFFVVLCQMLADALTKDWRSTRQRNSLWWMVYITNSVDKTKRSFNTLLLHKSTIKQPVLPFVLFKASRILYERNTSPSRCSHQDKACSWSVSFNKALFIIRG